jgi:hypothetical protein
LDLEEKERKGGLEPTIRILHRDNLLVIIQIMQQWRENPPTSIQLIVTHEVRVIALQRVEDQRLVRLWDLEVGEPSSVGEVELCDDGLHAQAGEFGVHLDVDALVGLDAYDEFVSRDVLEDAGGDVLELDADFGLLFVEGCEMFVTIARPWCERGYTPLPAFRMKGTPSHRSFLMYATIDAKVGQRDSFGTVSSSLYPGLLPSRDFPYWPMMTFLGSMEGIPRRTRT